MTKRASSRLRYRKAWLIRRLLLDHAWLFHVWNHLRDARHTSTLPLLLLHRHSKRYHWSSVSSRTLKICSIRIKINLQSITSISLSLFNFKMKEKDEEKENKKYRLSETRQDLNFDKNVVKIKINSHQYSTDYSSRKYKNRGYSCDDEHERQTLLSQHKLFPSCKEA